MKPFPHQYTVFATATPDGAIHTEGDGLPPLRVDSPAEFDGPGDRWSPESLLAAAVADCFVLTFRSIARASNLPWTGIECDLIGTLTRVDRALQFTHFEIRARLEVPDGTDMAAAQRMLEKSHRACLITNSLKATTELKAEICPEYSLTTA